ncbi:hypothetical protein [Phenylobacterium sp.]|uniref:hypothetical protein n=1 Tax=Phenylobacterium sp. TaxID=1871053 RepID=UPI0035B2BE4E
MAMKPKIVRGFRSRDPLTRVQTRDAAPRLPARRAARDEAPTVRVEVARFRASPGITYRAEQDGNDLVVSVTMAGVDTGQVYDGLERTEAAAPENGDQATKDRAARRQHDAAAAQLREINARNRAFWPRSPGKGAA